MSPGELPGSRPESALAVGLVFAVIMNAQLLLPNPYMPEAVRMAHLVEMASSNFIFGAFVAWLLMWRRSSSGDFSGGLARPPGPR